MFVPSGPERVCFWAGVNAVKSLEGGKSSLEKQTLGILMLDTRFPRIPGDIGNPETFPFPIRKLRVEGASTKRVVVEGDQALLEPFLTGAKELEKAGVGAITTSCGFLANFQKELASAVHIPVFTSAIMLVPLVRAMINPEQEIAIFTERAWNLTENHFLQAGFSSKDIPVVVSGMPEGSPFPELFIGNNLSEDREVLQSCMEELTRRHMAEHPNTGAIVFECTNFGPFSRYVQDIAKVPVFGINQLLEYIAACVDVRSYY